jgi:hypothetical protein
LGVFWKFSERNNENDFKHACQVPNNGDPAAALGISRPTRNWMTSQRYELDASSAQNVIKLMPREPNKQKIMFCPFIFIYNQGLRS